MLEVDGRERALAIAVGATLILAPLAFIPTSATPPLLDLATRMHGAQRAVNIHDHVTLPKMILAFVLGNVTLLLLWRWSRRASDLSAVARLFCALLPLSLLVAAVAVRLATGSSLQTVRSFRPYIPYLGLAGPFWATVFSQRARLVAIDVIILGAGLVALTVVAEVSGVPMPTSGAPWIDPPAALFTHRNLDALIIAGALPLALARLLAASSSARIAGWSFVLGLFAAALTATSSRTAIGAAFCGCAFLLILSMRARVVAPRQLAAALVTIAVGAAIVPHMRNRHGDVSLMTKTRQLVATIASGSVGETHLDRAAAAEPRGADVADHGLQDRIALWRFSAAEVRAQPLGVGLGDFKSALAAVLPPNSFVQPHAHNALVNLAVEGGVPLFAVGLATLGILMFAIVRVGARWSSPFDRRHAIPVAAAVVTFIAAAQLETVICDVGPNLVAGALAGALLGWSCQRTVDAAA
jgi:hypothetical protein